MASTLAYHNQHGRIATHLTPSPSSTSSPVFACPVPESLTRPATASSLSLPQSLPLSNQPLATAGATPVDAPNTHLQLHLPHQSSLSSWAGWPAGQQEGPHIGSQTAAGSASSPPNHAAAASAASAAGPRRPAATSSSSPRHRRQRSGRHIYTSAASASASASSPSPPRSSGSTSSTSDSLSPAASITTPTAGVSGASASRTMTDGAPRPVKRSPEDPDSDDPSSQTAKLKLPRLERGPDDFSNVVKNRLQSYTRTGQACDRCKVRKIRCDALPEGCSHCANLNLECYVTDRVTGRTERRGYMQQLEREKTGMLSYIRDLEKLLGDNGVEVKPWQGAQQAPDGTPDAAPPSSSSSAANDWTQSGSVWVKSKSPSSESPGTATLALRPKLHASRTDDEASSAGELAFNSIKGTKLSLLGMTIDTAGFQAADMEEPSDHTGPLYKRSPQAFLQTICRVNPLVQVDMPSRQDALTFCDWYFLVFSPYFPVIHKPTFMSVVHKIYDEPGFEPSASDLMILHVIFAMIYHNYGARNWQLEGRIHFTTLADKHYHLALSKFSDVMSAGDLPAMQALTLLAIYIRSFPKPGCMSLILGIVLQKAIDLGLHRKDPNPGEGTNLTKELRKRLWWSIMSVAVFMLGRLGRPMPITADQFDVEIPEAIADEHLNENGVDAELTIPCPFEVGLNLYRLTLIMLEAYTHMYSIRRDFSQYPHVVKVLEERVQQWDDALPDFLRPETPQQHPDTLVQAYYTKMFALEVRLCLRHPSVVPVGDKQMREENMRITEATAREILKLALEVVKHKAIDTTWYHITLFVICIFSTLSINWERRHELSQDQLAQLHDEMGRWVTVINDLGILMGNNPGLLGDVTQIVDRAFAWIEHDMRERDSKSHTSPSAFNPLHPSYNLPGPIPDESKFYKGAMPTFPVVPFDATTSPTYGAEQLFYTAPPAPAAAVAVADVPTIPVNLAFTSPTQLRQPDPSVWPNRGATWSDWGSMMAGNQGRYGTSMLAESGQAMPNEAVTQTPVEMAYIPPSQWPMNLFDAGPDAGSNSG